MAMRQLLTTQQGTRSWSDFMLDLERKSKILNSDKKPYRRSHHGCSHMSHEPLYTKREITCQRSRFEETHTVGTGKRSWKGRYVCHLKGFNICRLGFQKDAKINDEETNNMIKSLHIMKLRKGEKYSAHHNHSKTSCPHCNSSDPPEKCDANGKTCFDCGRKNHFAKSQARRFPSKIYKAWHTVKHIQKRIGNSSGISEVNNKQTHSNLEENHISFRQVDRCQDCWEVTICGYCSLRNSGAK